MILWVLVFIMKWFSLFTALSVYFQGQLSLSKMNKTTNTTNSTASTSLLKSSEILAWCFAYATVDFFIVVGNTIAIVIFTRSKLLRKRTNYFLLTLSIADMLVGCVSLPMFIHHVSLMIDSNVSELFRNIYLTLDIFTGFASIFALTIIALERLYAVALPNWHYTTQSYVYLILIVVIWLFAGIFGSLRMLFNYGQIKKDVFYNSTMAALFISLTIICLAYVCIAIKVRWRINEKTKRTIEKNRKLAVTLSIITLIFVFTWLPFYLLNMAFRFCSKTNCGLDKLDYNIVLSGKLLQYCNSFINPIIYSFKIPDFRVVLLRLFGRKTTARPSSTWISLKDTRKKSTKIKHENGNGTENGIFRKRIGSNENDSMPEWGHWLSLTSSFMSKWRHVLCLNYSILHFWVTSFFMSEWRHVCICVLWRHVIWHAETDHVTRSIKK